MNGQSHFNDDQNTVIRIIIAVSSGLGLIGALITIVSVIAFKHLRTAIARLIFCMAIADFVGILAKAIGPAGVHFGWLCQTQSALMQWGDLSSIFWTAMISFNLLFIMYFKKALADVKRYEKWYMVFCFLAPIPLSVVPLFLYHTDDFGNRIPMYGDADLWCWIDKRFAPERFFFFYGPLWAVFLFNLITYILVGALIWRMARGVRGGGAAQQLHKRKYVFGKNTSLYLLAFLITWTPSTINRLYQTLYTDSQNFVLSMLMALCSPARGFTNFLVYFYLTWYVQVKENRTHHPHLSSSSSSSNNQGEGESQYPKTGVESSILVTGRGLSGIESEIGIDSQGYEKHTSRRWVVAQQAGIYLHNDPSTYLSATDQARDPSFYTATQGRRTVSGDSPRRECTTSELYEAQSYAGLDTMNSEAAPPPQPTAPTPPKSRSSTTRREHPPARVAGLPLSDFGMAPELPQSARTSVVSDTFAPTSMPEPHELGRPVSVHPQDMQIQSRSQKTTTPPPPA